MGMFHGGRHAGFNKENAKAQVMSCELEQERDKEKEKREGQGDEARCRTLALLIQSWAETHMLGVRCRASTCSVWCGPNLVL